jgi:hypothetical protein
MKAKETDPKILKKGVFDVLLCVCSAYMVEQNLFIFSRSVPDECEHSGS